MTDYLINQSTNSFIHLMVSIEHFRLCYLTRSMYHENELRRIAQFNRVVILFSNCYKLISKENNGIISSFENLRVHLEDKFHLLIDEFRFLTYHIQACDHHHSAYLRLQFHVYRHTNILLVCRYYIV